MSLIFPLGSKLGPELTLASADTSSIESRITVVENHLEVYRDWAIRSYLGTNVPEGLTLKVLYQFDAGANDLNDRSGNGHTLSLISGTNIHTYNETGLAGLSLRQNTWFRSGYGDKSNTGAGTIEVATRFQTPTVATDYLFHIGNAGSGVEADNIVMGIAIDILSAGGEFWGCHESGGGTFRYAALGGLPRRNLDTYIALVRAEDGVTYSIYFNGVLFGSGATAAAPTGGTNTAFYVGGQDTNSDYFGDIYCVRYSSGAMTAAQIAAVNTEIRRAW